jgi:DNA polymerase III subunit delta
VKASGAEAARRLAAERGAPRPGFLLYGPDAMLVSLARQAVVAALIGPEGEAEMRLDRLAAQDLRREPGALGDAMRSRGFFAGDRVVLLEGAGDPVAEPVLAALAAHAPGDATLVVAAGPLAAKSALRRGFENHPRAAAVALYPDPPGPAEIAARLTAAGLAGASPDARDRLLALGAELDAGAFEQFLRTLALYCHGQSEPVALEDVEAVAPGAGEADIDDLLDAVAEGEAAAIGPRLKRLAARGTTPVTLAIAASRHFRALHAATSSPDSAEAALSRQRPPVFGPRRARLAAQARRLGQPGAEKALALLTDTDLALRSSRPVPGLALVERALIRIAMLAGR